MTGWVIDHSSNFRSAVF